MAPSLTVPGVRHKQQSITISTRSTTDGGGGNIGIDNSDTDSIVMILVKVVGCF